MLTFFHFLNFFRQIEVLFLLFINFMRAFIIWNSFNLLFLQLIVFIVASLLFTQRKDQEEVYKIFLESNYDTFSSRFFYFAKVCNES